MGEVIPSLGTEQEPSARETVNLIRAIKAQGVRAIFTKNIIDNKLARTISGEANVKIAPPLYTDALGAPDSPADTYLGALRLDWGFPVTVWDVAMMGRTARLGWLRRPGKRDREIVRGALAQAGVQDLARLPIAQLSGGKSSALCWRARRGSYCSTSR